MSAQSVFPNRRKALQLAAAGILLAGLLFGWVPPAPAAPAAADLTWTTPALLSPLSQSSWFPDIFADLAGRVHVVWSSGIATGPRQEFDTVIYRSTVDGVNWTPPVDIAALPTKGAVTRATLLVDPTGWFHLTYRSYTIYYAHAPVTDVRAARLLPAQPVSSPDVGYFSRMVLDTHGRLHLFYTENAFIAGCTGCFHAYHRWSEDGGNTWSAPVDISPVPTGVAKPQIVVDDQDNLHVVLEMGRGGDLGQVPEPATVAYVASYDRGATWTQPRTFAPVEQSTRNIAIGLDRSGALVASWLLADPEKDQVFYSVSADRGRTWSDPQPIPGIWGGWALYQAKTDTYMMTRDSAGTLYLMLVGREQQTDETLSVLCLRWDGSAWSAPQAVMTIKGDVPEWPRLAVSNGNQLNLVWFVRNKAGIFGDDRQYSVWYTRATAAAPAVPTVVWPTAQPTAPVTATPDRRLARTPSATPTQRLLLTPSAQALEPYNESDYLLIAAASLVPVLALIAAVVGFNRLRKR